MTPSAPRSGYPGLSNNGAASALIAAAIATHTTASIAAAPAAGATGTLFVLVSKQLRISSNTRASNGDQPLLAPQKASPFQCSIYCARPLNSANTLAIVRYSMDLPWTELKLT